MATKTHSGATEAMTMWKAAFLEFPAASMQWGWGAGKKEDVATTAWKGYDAWVRWTNATINEVYKTSAFGDWTARTLDTSLRWQRLSQALVRAAAASLWPTMGLPTAAALQASSEEIQALSSQMQRQDLRLQVLHTELRNLREAVLTPRKKLAAPALDAALRILPTEKNGRGVLVDSANAA